MLRHARLGAGRTPHEAAQALGIDETSYAALELGAAEPSIPQMEILARTLSVPVTRFWADGALPAPAGASLPLDKLIVVRRRMIGVLLRQARLAAGKSVAQCAVAINASAEEMTAYEYGFSDIPFTRLEGLAQLLGVPVSYFVDEDLLSEAEREQQALELLGQLPDDVRQFVLQPGNALYLRLAMLLNRLPAETLRRLGEGLLDITL